MVEAVVIGSFVDAICYNCGIRGHHKANCKKLRVCFICKKEDHVVEECPVKKQGHTVAKYNGSAASGLGFYYYELLSQAYLCRLAI